MLLMSIIYFIRRTKVIFSVMTNNITQNPEITLNSDTLKTLKQRVLRQAYDQQLVLHEKLRPSLPSEPSQYSSLKSLSTSQSLGEINKNYHIQTGLNQNRSIFLQPDLKSTLKKQADRRRHMEENDLLNDVIRHQSLQMQKQKSIRENYKRDLQQEIIRKQSTKQIQKQSEKVEDRRKMNREWRTRNKQTSFKEFYNNADLFRDNAAKQYLDYIGTSNNKLHEKSIDKIEAQQNQKIIRAQLLQQDKVRREKKEALRVALQQQIIQSQAIKSTQLCRYKNSGYEVRDPNTYSPIYNPIDYKMDISNKYILSEVISRKQPTNL